MKQVMYTVRFKGLLCNDVPDSMDTDGLRVHLEKDFYRIMEEQSIECDIIIEGVSEETDA